MVIGFFVIGIAGTALANLFHNGNFDELDDRIGLQHKSVLNSLSDGKWEVYDGLPGGWLVGYGPGIEIQYNSVIDACSSNYYVELDSHGSSSSNVSLVKAPVPEPATILLFGACLAGLASVRFIRKKK